MGRNRFTEKFKDGVRETKKVLEGLKIPIEPSEATGVTEDEFSEALKRKVAGYRETGLTVLVDMDDVLTELVGPWIKALNDIHGTSVKEEDVVEWDFEHLFEGIPEGEIYAPLLDENFWKTVTAVEGARKYLRKIIKDGHKVVVVTASHPATIYMKIENALLRHFPYLTIDNVVMAKDKSLIKGDVLIDDAPHNLINSHTMRVLLDKRHNRSFNEEEHEVYRARNWEDIYNFVSLASDTMEFLYGTMMMGGEE